MATPVEMPKLGNTVEECLISRWLKHPGDAVSTGELIAEIETDKATFEVTAPAAGTMLDLFFEEGALVPVFTNLCVIGEAGENVDPFRPQPVAATPQDAPRHAPAAPPEPPPAQVTTAFSPRARRFAAEHQFHPEAVAGSGPGGRVLEEDVRKLYHASAKTSFLAKKWIESGYQAGAEGSGLGGIVLAADLVEPPLRISSLRGKIARRMRESLANSAQYTLHASADASGLLALRRRIKAAGATPNINELVMFCVVRALLQMPELNAEFVDGHIHRHTAIHLGFACDTPRGLLVPVVKDSQKLALAELSQQVKELTARATEGSIAVDDLAGATFTVSNLGSLGIESFTPILNPPQVAILGVNAIALKPVRRDARVEFIDSIGLSLTCDHQVIDGAPGARFLQILAAQIEKVESLCTI
jgi:pyruvate dehydrogenase E2 component (dihydrolipoyllysine-residue acetyltransferase)